MNILLLRRRNNNNGNNDNVRFLMTKTMIMLMTEV